MDADLWTAEQLRDQCVMELPTDYCYVTGEPVGSADFYYREPLNSDDPDTRYACVVAAAGYDVEIFDEDPLATLDAADYGLWSLLSLPRSVLSEEALSNL